MANKDTKRPTGTLKAAIKAVSAEVKESPSYLRDIYARNDVLDQHRRRDPVQSTRISLTRARSGGDQQRP